MGALEVFSAVGLGVIGMFVVFWWLWRLWDWMCDLVERWRYR